jgi:hypothetical protein
MPEPCRHCTFNLFGFEIDRVDAGLVIAICMVAISVFILLPWVKAGADCKSECNMALQEMYDTCVGSRGWYALAGLNTSKYNYSITPDGSIVVPIEELVDEYG